MIRNHITFIISIHLNVVKTTWIKSTIEMEYI